MAALDRTLGNDAELVVQDELGHLTNVAPVSVAVPSRSVRRTGA
jgi:hypothetical protein